MAARRIRGDVRQRKVTVFTRPPELNVIVEDQGQGQCEGRPECQGRNEGQDESQCQCEGENGSQRVNQELNQSSILTSDNDEEQGPLRRVSAKSKFVPKQQDTSVSHTNGRWRSDSISSWSPPSRGPDGLNDELVRLKQYADKLNLPTRRPSYLTWRQEHFGPGDTPLLTPCEHEGGSDDVTWSPERREKMDAILEAIKQDLRGLREEDQTLARRLMTLRREVHEVKVSRYYTANRDMLEEAMFNEEHDELDALCDLPPRLFSPALKQYGLTRMNVQTRRFSVF